MYSPTKNNYEVRIGDNNKKIYIIKGRRHLKDNPKDYIKKSSLDYKSSISK